MSEAESQKLADDVPPEPHPSGIPGATLASPVGSEDEELPTGALGPEGEGPAWLPLVLAAAVPILYFFVLPPLTKSGLWDPHELNVADLARRIALNLHGAENLRLDGADNSLPHLNDLGRPQLAFTSIALGFRAFGLHEWAGRAPLALWGFVGVLATYAWVSRLVDKRAGVFAAVALTTMPLYFVQARTMLGDIVTMSGLTMAFGGLLVATVGQNEEEHKPLPIGWIAMGLLGLATGFWNRGAFLGVGLPTLAVGLTWLLAYANGDRRIDPVGHGVGAVCGLVALPVLYMGVRAMGAERTADLSPWLGAMIRPAAKYPTYEFIVGHVTSALAPWSAFAPFAFGRLFIAPVGRVGAAFDRESRARLGILVAGGVALVLHGWMAERTDLVAFSAPAIIAAGCAVALRDYERGAHPSVAVGVGTAVFLGIFHHEFHDLPEKAFHAFSVVGATFPETFKAHSLSVWTVVLVGFAGIAFLTMVERDSKRKPFDPKSYLKALLALRDAWDGLLALSYFAMVAGASLAGLAVWIGTRQHAKWLPTLSSQMRDGVLNAWWATAFVPILVVFGTYFWCDVWLWAFGGRRYASRGSLARGFEPFEELASALKNGNLGSTVPRLITGKLVLSESNIDEGIGLTALFLLAPLLYLQVPAAVFVGLYTQGVRLPVALALAIPSGIALFLGLGIVGDILRGSRAAFLVVFGSVVGAILCFSYYPALANQLSPKEVFESYQRVRKSDEPLALFGVGGRTAAYYAGGQPLMFKDTDAALGWLLGSEPGKRRFLAVRAEELPRLNRAWRERRREAPTNIPVLDARSSQIILVASALAEGEKNQNPLDQVVLATPPKPRRPLEAQLEDKLAVLGYDITDMSGRIVDHAAPGKKYHQRTYFRVLAPVQSEWEMFIHIDGFHRRHNGDHKITGGKYPISLWLKDDIVVDDHEFTLEPNFTPGAYTVYFGLFVGETRMKVVGGDTENRVNGGQLRVQ